MDEKIIYVSPDDIEILDNNYREDLSSWFKNIPDVSKPLIKQAQDSLKQIEKTLYNTPKFVNFIKAAIPEQSFQAMLTNSQKKKLAAGTIKLMTKKDGTLIAKLIDPKSKKIISNIPLRETKISPALTQAITSYTTQMQVAQIAEQIQIVQLAIEEVRKGQEYDRLATAYSCQQKLLQAIEITNPDIKKMALLRIAYDSEDSRNLLMLNQNSKLSYIKKQPETYLGKVIKGDNKKDIDDKLNEIRENLCAINMVSLVEAIAYQELGEYNSAKRSLQYYADYICNIYLNDKYLIDRLDSNDSFSNNYWSNFLTDINKKIKAIPFVEEIELMEEKTNDSKQKV